MVLSLLPPEQRMPSVSYSDFVKLTSRVYIFVWSVEANIKGPNSVTFHLLLVLLPIAAIGFPKLAKFNAKEEVLTWKCSVFLPGKPESGPGDLRSFGAGA
jgi:hypothetical protein